MPLTSKPCRHLWFWVRALPVCDRQKRTLQSWRARSSPSSRVDFNGAYNELGWLKTHRGFSTARKERQSFPESIG
jgi:hypothetical protein